MSIDTSKAYNTQSFHGDLYLRRARTVFGNAAKGGSVYRWGIAAARSSDIDDLTDAVCRLAVGESLANAPGQPIPMDSAVDSFVDWLRGATDLTPADCAAIVTWAAALPGLRSEIDDTIWTDLFESMLLIRESVLEQNNVSSPIHLMIGAELALTLHGGCHELSATDGFDSDGWMALSDWVQRNRESISASLERPPETRLVMASLIRCQRWIEAGAKGCFTKEMHQVALSLAEWVCAMTVRGGSTMFSEAMPDQVCDDLGKHGLLAATTHFAPESLPDALTAALGETPTGGRLTWQALLPATFYHDAGAKIAVMFADWDVARARAHVGYSGQEVELEIYAGSRRLTTGRWQTFIETDDGQEQPDGDWNETCEFSDDDVHYLEIEQPWTGDLLLQRQLMLIRDDRCLLLADSIVPQAGRHCGHRSIRYRSRLPIDGSIEASGQPETRELLLRDDRKRALVIPLSANEWSIGATDATLSSTDDGSLTLNTYGSGSLYAPLWVDFRRCRFKRMRTWRQLTIADRLRIVGRDEAVGYRIQVGSEQWVIYRSLGERACRSFLGKHLIADFFAARFDPEDGGHETLVTVDDDEHES